MGLNQSDAPANVSVGEEVESEMLALNSPPFFSLL